MSNKSSIVFSNLTTAVVIIAVSYFIFFRNHSGIKGLSDLSPVTTDFGKELSADTAVSIQNKTDAKTFVFDNFHGSTNLSDKFQFYYPASFDNEGQYFSPQKIEYYDLYSIKAPFYFDLILASIFEQTEFKNQINISKRKSPDSHGKIDGREFNRYDLIDYGSYGGESAGRVIIYVGPTIKIDGLDYYLVFHWEEKPLVVSIPGNNPVIFEKMVSTIKFNK